MKYLLFARVNNPPVGDQTFIEIFPVSRGKQSADNL